MGFFDKIKNLFTDEPEEPIKKEFIPVEIASPKIEESKTDINISDSTVIQKVEKIQSPVFFSDKDFEDLNNRSFHRHSRMDFPKDKKEEKKEETRVFKPSPIISPVYGVLDKNYRKDDIIKNKPININNSQVTKEISIDDVRKKAYGTLEEELEKEMFGGASMLFKEDLIIEEEPDLFEELKNKDEILIHNIDEINEDSIDTFVEDEIVNMFDNDDDQLTEGDLFDLVNSMYEKGDEINE